MRQGPGAKVCPCQRNGMQWRLALQDFEMRVTSPLAKKSCYFAEVGMDRYGLRHLEAHVSVWTCLTLQTCWYAWHVAGTGRAAASVGPRGIGKFAAHRGIVWAMEVTDIWYAWQESQDLINTKWVYNAPLCSLLYVPIGSYTLIGAAYLSL